MVDNTLVKEEQGSAGAAKIKQDENCFVFTDFKTFHIRAEKSKEHDLFDCPVCKAKFSDKGALVSHFQAHTKSDLISVTDKTKLPKCMPYQCEQCKEQFSQATELAQHVLARRCSKPIKPYQCNICDKFFGLEASLRQHKKLKTHGRKET